MFAVPGHVAMVPNHTAFSSAIVITHIFNNACPWRSPGEPHFYFPVKLFSWLAPNPPVTAKTNILVLRCPSVIIYSCNAL